MGGFSLWHWLIVLLIVVLVFGTKRLGNIGKDLGDAVKGFKKGMQDDDKSSDGRPSNGKPVERLGDDAQRTTEVQRDSDRNDQAR